MNSNFCADRSRLAFLYNGKWFTEIYERSVGIFSSWCRPLLFASIPIDVGCFSGERLFERPSNQVQLCHHHSSAQSIYSIWWVPISHSLLFNSNINVSSFFSILIIAASIFPAIFIVIASYAECNRVYVVASFTLAMGFMGNFYPGMKVNSLDLSPNYAGSLMALSNGLGALTGVAAPTFVGIMTPDVSELIAAHQKWMFKRTNSQNLPKSKLVLYLHWKVIGKICIFQSSLRQWRLVFWITFGIAMVRTVIFSIWASAKVQPFNNPKDNTLTECDKLNVNIEIETSKECLDEENCR